MNVTGVYSCANCGRIGTAGKDACDAHSRPNRYAFSRKAARLMVNTTKRPERAGA